MPSAGPAPAAPHPCAGDAWTQCSMWGTSSAVSPTPCLGPSGLAGPGPANPHYAEPPACPPGPGGCRQPQSPPPPQLLHWSGGQSPATVSTGHPARCCGQEHTQSPQRRRRGRQRGQRLPAGSQVGQGPAAGRSQARPPRCRPGLSQLRPRRPLGHVVPAAKGGLHFPSPPLRSLAAGRGKAAGCPGPGPVPWRGGPGREASGGRQEAGGERGCGGGRGIAAAGWAAWITARYRERGGGGTAGGAAGSAAASAPPLPTLLPCSVWLRGGFPPKWGCSVSVLSLDASTGTGAAEHSPARCCEWSFAALCQQQGDVGSCSRKDWERSRWQ